MVNSNWIAISTGLSLKITRRLKELDLSPAYIANLLGITPKDAFIMLTGKWNFTLRDIARLEVALDKDLIKIRTPYKNQGRHEYHNNYINPLWHNCWRGPI